MVRIRHSFCFRGHGYCIGGNCGKAFWSRGRRAFLAFPAIFPAAATLIEKHEKQKEAGKDGEKRARAAVGVDAAGAAMGSIGLVVFALIVWQGLPNSSLGTVLAGATLAWLVTSVLVWEFREIVCRRLRAHQVRASHIRLDQGNASEGRLNSPAHHSPAHHGSSTTRRFDE